MKPFLQLLFLLSATLSLHAQRDARKWPFSKTSIWNMPIHKDAQYLDAKLTVPEKGFLVDEDYIVLKSDAPLTKIYTNYAGWNRRKDRCTKDGSVLFSAPIPSDFVINKSNWLGATPNAGLAVLMPDGKTIKQTQPFARCTPGEDATSQYVFQDQDIYGDGYYGAHGASKLSAIGGTLRLGELVPGGVIRHAMKINLYCHKNAAYNNDGSPGFRWPALSADGYAGNCVKNPEICYGGKNPAVEVGALLALPPSIDMNTLRLETEPGKILAMAFQNYGTYLVDDAAWDVFAIVTEYSPDGRVIDEFKKSWGYSMETNKDSPWGRDLVRIISKLQVIDNNTAATIGGGPVHDFKNRRAPMAPDFKVSNSIRILPIGNSLTQNNTPGYRGYLYQSLKASGYNIDFVGTKQSPPENGGDPDHSGYGGFIIGPGNSKGDSWNPPFRGNIFDNLTSGYNILKTDCEVILLEIGINDFFNSTDSTYKPELVGPKKLDGLLNKIFEAKPEVILVVSNITPFAGNEDFAKSWNEQLPAVIKKYKKGGRKCYLADLRNG
ncbi:MAG: hypothetical protein WKI04_18980, partial [Ferruginibacter sp.]